MHHDDFTALEPSFQPFDDGFNSFGGCYYDLDDSTVDPYLESFNLGTVDPTAIGIRAHREELERQAAQSFASLQEEERVEAEGWVAAAVRGDEPEDDVEPATLSKVQRWELAERLSLALARELGYVGDRDDDCWYRPTREEWLHLPTDYMAVYNRAYERFCSKVGKRLPVDRTMATEEWREAVALEAMQRAAAELDVPAPRRLRIVRAAPY